MDTGVNQREQQRRWGKKNNIQELRLYNLTLSKFNMLKHDKSQAANQHQAAFGYVQVKCGRKKKKKKKGSQVTGMNLDCVILL